MRQKAIRVTEDTANIELGIIQLAGDIVAAYVTNNHIAAADLPALIETVHSTISGLVGNGQATKTVEPASEKATAAQIRKSVQPDGLISFIDGRAYKTLKRHLTANGLTPAAYCAQFGLPSDYPMVAPSYSERRSNLAKAAGLGQPRRGEVEVVDVKRTQKMRKNAA